MLDASQAVVEVRRSARRRKTLSAYRDGDKIVVLLPAHIGRRAEAQLVPELVQRLLGKEVAHQSSGARAGDPALATRARGLSERYLGGQARPRSVRWVRNMRSRWGSCTMPDRTIRLSHRLQQMPDWVIDYVLMHELVHLLESGHTARFWSLVANYPRTERARGYLEGVAAAAQLSGWSDCEPAEPESEPPSDPSSGWFSAALE